MAKKKTKICFRCKRHKPLKHFYADENHPTGLSSWCRKCKQEYSRERSPAFDAAKDSVDGIRRQKIAAYHRQYRAARKAELELYGRHLTLKERQKFIDRHQVRDELEAAIEYRRHVRETSMFGRKLSPQENLLLRGLFKYWLKTYGRYPSGKRRRVYLQSKGSVFP